MLGLGALLFASELRAADDEIVAPTRIETVRVRDGVNIAVAVYLPRVTDAIRRCSPPRPIASTTTCCRRRRSSCGARPDRSDGISIHGYAFVHIDVRGTGRSEGEYRFLDSKEQSDFHDVIEWVAQQPWSDGKIAPASGRCSKQQARFRS